MDDDTKRSTLGKRKGRGGLTSSLARASYLPVGLTWVACITPAIAIPEGDEREVGEQAVV